MHFVPSVWRRMQGKKSRVARGEVVTLTQGHYAAGVSVVGATLDWLKFNGRDLVRPNSENDFEEDFNGAVCAPWPYHTTGDTYTFQGKEYQLPETPFHCSVCSREYKVRERSINSVKLSHFLWPQPGYPFHLEITVDYSLDSDKGLEITVAIRNCGKQTSPNVVFGKFFVIAGPEPMAQWAIRVPHTWVQRGDTSSIELAHTSAIDMRAARVIGAQRISDVFGGLELDGEGRWGATVIAPGGTGVEVSASYSCPWVVLEVSRQHRHEKGWCRGAAIMPTTSSLDAFSSGIDLIALEPGRSHTVSWRIRQLGDSPPTEKAPKDSPHEPKAPNFPCD